MSELHGPSASPAAPSLAARRRWWVLAGVLLLVATSMPMLRWLPRAPTATVDRDTWRLFGRPSRPGTWVAGDGSYPVTLPDGGVAWLFGDSQVRRADGTDTIVHNTIVVQDARGQLRTLTGGTTAQPADLIPSPRPGAWLWPASGFVERGRLMVFAEEFTRPTGGGEGFQAADRRYLVPFHLPDLTMAVPRPVYDGPVAWGHAVLVSAGEVYVYGNLQQDGWTNRTYLARFPLGRSAGYWGFWDGRRFTPNPLTAAPLLSSDGRALAAKLASVIPHPAAIGGGFAALAIDPFANTIDLRIAFRPQGPWSPKRVLYTTPEAHPYLPRARITANGAVQLAYSVANSRPRYLTVRG